MAGSGWAAEFVTVGPRAAGMGGAGVAVTTEALATYWNPAGLALEPSTELRLHGGAGVTDRLGVIQILDDLHGLDLSNLSPANQGRLQTLVDRLARPGASVGASGAAGLAVKWNAMGQTWGLSVADVATGGVWASVVDPVVTVAGGRLANNTQVTWNALEARQIGLSSARAPGATAAWRWG